MLDDRLIALDKTLKEANDDSDESAIVSAIYARVTELLDKNPELLMSYLYRLDVLEKDLNIVLDKNSPIPIPQAITDLIWRRQKARIETKKKYKQDPIEGWGY